MTCLYDFYATRQNGVKHALDHYRGQIVLIVNVASRCGFTSHYAGLEELYRDYRDREFSVLAFPCNQFAHQEPLDNAAIRAFCELQYGISFPVYDKIHVNGAQAHPLYRWLKKAKPGLFGSQGIKWNFTKFLLGRDGQAIKRYGPGVTPARLRQDIEHATKDAASIAIMR